MKKILFFAVMLALATGMTAKPKKAKTDAVTAATAQQQVKKSATALTTKSDSVCYAAGYAYTNGLLPYLQQQMGIDTAYMADFIEGFKEVIKHGNDPRHKALIAGANIAQMVQERMLPDAEKRLKDVASPFNSDLFYEGFIASVSNDSSKFTIKTAEDYYQKVQEKAGKDWLKANQTKPGVVTTASGLQYKVITMGTGERPKADQEVEVKYEGHLIDGTEFDSSYKRNPQTTKFKCNQVIKGWTEGLQLMPVGSKFEFYIPYELAYGERGNQGIPPYSTLIFTVELVSITK